MKQMDVKVEKTIGGNKYYIRPFPAFAAANLSGELFAIIGSQLASIAPIITQLLGDDKDSLLEIDAEKAAPVLASGLSTLSGDRIEMLLKKILINSGNIAVEKAGTDDTVVLTEDEANEIFAGDVQDMFILAIEVIKANYDGFFKKLGDRFGGVLGSLLEKV